MNEHYFVHSSVWFSVVDSNVGMLCVGCLEIRLGRELVHTDFPDVSINNIKYGNKSVRLLDRLSRKTENDSYGNTNQSSSGKNHYHGSST
jgi:hypothetical protein